GGRFSYVHAMAEGGTAQLARSLAMTHARDNIQVNALGIGMFTTHERTERSEEAHAQFLPAKRYAAASEIGPYTVFLASDASNYLTGQVVYIDGGIQPAGF